MRIENPFLMGQFNLSNLLLVLTLLKDLHFQLKHQPSVKEYDFLLNFVK